MDADAARELKIFAENDADLYRQRTTPIVRNLRTKQAQGKYDRELAVKAFMYLAEAGARKYAREYGTGEHEWSKLFPRDVRLAVSREWRDEFESESALGNYDSETYLPKKYLQPARAPKTSSHSAAYANGKRDASAWILATDPLPRSLHAIVDPLPGMLSPTESLIQREGPARASKKLGIPIPTRPVRGYDPAHTTAASEYDAGYLDVCRRRLGAVEKTTKPRTAKVGSDSSHDGAELAQRVASNLTEHEIEQIVLLGRDPPDRKRGPVFKQGYLRRMQAILQAMRGN